MRTTRTNWIPPQPIWSTGSPTAPTVALGLTKWLLQSGNGLDLDRHLQNEALALELSSRSEDFKEGLSAFREKRDCGIPGPLGIMTRLSINESTSAGDAVSIVSAWVEEAVPAAWREAAAEGPKALRAVRSPA